MGLRGHPPIGAWRPPLAEPLNPLGGALRFRAILDGEFSNLGIQVSFGNGIWQVSITPPFASVGFGGAASVITTNTVTTKTGCHP